MLHQIALYVIRLQNIVIERDGMGVAASATRISRPTLHILFLISDVGGMKGAWNTLILDAAEYVAHDVGFVARKLVAGVELAIGSYRQISVGGPTLSEAEPLAAYLVHGLSEMEKREASSRR